MQHARKLSKKKSKYHSAINFLEFVETSGVFLSFSSKTAPTETGVSNLYYLKSHFAALPHHKNLSGTTKTHLSLIMKVNNFDLN